MPQPRTAIVRPPASSAPAWAAASMPSASPLTTATPARARPAASLRVKTTPADVGRREPTIATHGEAHSPSAGATPGSTAHRAGRPEMAQPLRATRPARAAGARTPPSQPFRPSPAARALRRPAPGRPRSRRPGRPRSGRPAGCARTPGPTAHPEPTPARAAPRRPRRCPWPPSRRAPAGVGPDLAALDLAVAAAPTRSATVDAALGPVTAHRRRIGTIDPHDQIEPIQQRARQPSTVRLHPLGTAHTVPPPHHKGTDSSPPPAAPRPAYAPAHPPAPPTPPHPQAAGEAPRSRYAGTRPTHPGTARHGNERLDLLPGQPWDILDRRTTRSSGGSARQRRPPTSSGPFAWSGNRHLDCSVVRSPRLPIGTNPGSFRAGIEADVLPTCARYGMGVITWAPPATGWLSGRWRKRRESADSTRRAHAAGQRNTYRVEMGLAAEEALGETDVPRPPARRRGDTLALDLWLALPALASAALALVTDGANDWYAWTLLFALATGLFLVVSVRGGCRPARRPWRALRSSHSRCSPSARRRGPCCPAQRPRRGPVSCSIVVLPPDSRARALAV